MQCQPQAQISMNWGTNWHNLHNLLAMNIAASDLGPANTTGLQVIFYGDSITEHFMGTSGGLPEMQKNNGSAVSPDMAADVAVWKRNFGFSAGDQIGHLWWRLLNGELPVDNQPGVVVVLIGINDLGAAAYDKTATDADLLAAARGPIADRAWGMLQVIRAALPGTHVVLQGVLPRGAELASRNMFTWPNRFTAAIAALNAQYERFAAADRMIHYVYCGERFVNPDGIGIVQTLLKDGLHPHGPGLEILSGCVAPLVAQFASAAAAAAH